MTSKYTFIGIELTESFVKFVPRWILKLPTNIQLLIVFFVALHLVGLAFVILLSTKLYGADRSRPDFKAKIK
jgi:hypothetical protein